MFSKTPQITAFEYCNDLIVQPLHIKNCPQKVRSDKPIISWRGIMVRVIGNGPGDRGSISSRVIPKAQKMVLHASLLNTQPYKVQIKGKWSNTGKGVASSPPPRCNSNWKGSLEVILNNSRPTFDIFMYNVYQISNLKPTAVCKLFILRRNSW